jgi:hypothetical protein
VVREKRVGTAIDRIAPLPALPMHSFESVLEEVRQALG